MDNLVPMNKFKLTYNMKQLNIILAVLLLLCLFKMPYGYYTLMRLAQIAEEEATAPILCISNTGDTYIDRAD